ncbi:GNAT family N-acetyltransferase [Paenibacillus sp. MMS20-IR301]|uniref:GNAT family N-acetyltransferase n=1 Tax=Paenibacillus sp. MMS20-IR301 TaxID=2895946 RepID=UPI0028EC4DC1|nr:GNAT family N-acetyltransferase [Paenibacillus sp. MMS20-IR301]WNS45846.1 N-acetyltransferase family protein [Paenibacillus sp. MMS20-IR301]
MGKIMAGGLRFTEITEEDLPEVLDIYNYYVLNTTVSFHTEPQTLPQMAQALLHGDPRFKSYVILADEVMQGYVLITKHKNKEAYDTSGEVTIYLKPGSGGQGLGGKSLRFIEERAAELGFHVLVATVCADNEPSRRLFTKYGYEQSALFKEIGRKFGRWLDIVSYQKIIGS